MTGDVKDMEATKRIPSLDDVFKAIDGERDYQEWRWGGNRHTPGAFVVFMTAYFNQAMARASKESGWDGALDEVRKVAALGVACMEQNGVAPIGWPRCDPPVTAESWRHVTDRKDVYASVAGTIAEMLKNIDMSLKSWPPDIGSQLLIVQRMLELAPERSHDATRSFPFDDTSILRVAQNAATACVLVMLLNGIVKRSDAWRGVDPKAEVSQLKATERQDSRPIDRVGAVEVKLETLWTEVFAARVATIGGTKDDPVHKSRQTLRGAVLDLCTVNNSNIGNDKTPIIVEVEPPKVPWAT